ncbi:phosphoadenosine phosphosulfate reductase family protein [Escherichia coli]
MDQIRLTHLQQLEAESIHIIREVAAEFENPVMMYSIGKDSSVMLHLARKAFYPGKIPFPLLHVDTDWKFKEMDQVSRTRLPKSTGWISSSTRTRTASPWGSTPSCTAAASTPTS